MLRTFKNSSEACFGVTAGRTAITLLCCTSFQQLLKSTNVTAVKQTPNTCQTLQLLARRCFRCNDQFILCKGNLQRRRAVSAAACNCQPFTTPWYPAKAHCSERQSHNIRSLKQAFADNSCCSSILHIFEVCSCCELRNTPAAANPLHSNKTS